MTPSAQPRDSFTQAVAAQIRAERAGARLTQADVWKQAGLARSTYLRIEGAERDIDVDQLRRIAPVFGLTVSELVARAEDRVRRSAAGGDLDAQLAAEIAGAGLSERNRREVEAAARETAAAPGEVDQRSGDERHHA